MGGLEGEGGRGERGWEGVEGAIAVPERGGGRESKGCGCKRERKDLKKCSEAREGRKKGRILLSCY